MANDVFYKQGTASKYDALDAAGTLIRNKAAQLDEAAGTKCAALLPGPPQKGYVSIMQYADEVLYITKTLLNMPKLRSYLEIGAGGSSQWYASLARSSGVVDNNPEWCAIVRKTPTIDCLLASGRMKMKCTSVTNASTVLGFVTRDKVMEVGRAYIQGVLSVAKTKGPFDAVLIDGRYRAAFAIFVMHLLTRRGVVFVHDFWPRFYEYRSYRRVLSYYEVIGRTRSLAVLRPYGFGKSPEHPETEEQWANEWETHLIPELLADQT